VPVECQVSRAGHDHVVSTHVEAAAEARARDLQAKLAEELKGLMADAGVSQRALAASSGVPRSFLARILAGDASPSARTYA